VIWKVEEYSLLWGGGLLLVNGVGVWVVPGDVGLCMCVCEVEEWDEFFWCVASFD
jgi:hypothetical protein